MNRPKNAQYTSIFLHGLLKWKSSGHSKGYTTIMWTKTIFRFKLNDHTLGMQKNAVEKQFMPDDNLETWYLDDKGEDVTVHLIHLKLPTVFSV